ncbi:hypothetical protein [Methylocella silvestris]|uniref:hypothetical protein n=1 Tax=Methylocella silvestris TaxID=199596 RepID=UPI001FDEAF33|nr:hypothetical protein [Methylocella silvestris]
MNLDTEPVSHDIRVVKNVTITLREEIADWLRVEAAKAGMSMSAFIGGLLETRMGRGKEQIAGLELFLSGPGFPGLAADLPKRDELYDRAALHRHQHSDLRARSGGADQARDLSGFAEADDSEPYLGSEPTKSE